MITAGLAPAAGKSAEPLQFQDVVEEAPRADALDFTFPGTAAKGEALVFSPMP